MALVQGKTFWETAPWPIFDREIQNAVQEVLASGRVNYWTGTEGRNFEKEFAEHCQTKHAIAMMNGSVTIEGALRALGIGEGDEVIVTPRSFMASASSVVLVGAKPIFADVDRKTGNLNAATIAEVITPKTKAVIPVHLGGWPCDMDPIMDLANQSGITVIEDCAQAHGAVYHGRPVGSIGRISSWSFCQDKILTTGGEGGMITTNDDELWDTCWSLKDHGKTYDAVYNRNHPIGFRWLHERFGSNWRMTEMQSAIGRVILRQLPDWTAKRTRNAEILLRELSNLDLVRIETPEPGIDHAYYKFYCYLEFGAMKTGWDRNRIMAEIIDRGFPAFSGTCSEMYLEKNFQDAGLAPANRLPVAQELGETSLMFVVHPTIPEEMMNEMASAIRSVLLSATA